MHRAPETGYSYHAYGCNLVSDLPLVRLSPGTLAGLETITVRFCEDLPEIPEGARQMGPFSWAAPGFLALNVEGVVQLVAMGGTRLLYRPYAGVDDVSVQLFLMGSGLGAILMQRQLLVLHGNAVEIDGACVMCLGASGAGKSTTAAGLMQRGHRVMSDDICAINAAGEIVPGMPHIKLWQEAADILGVSTQSLDRVRPELQKYGVPLNDAFCEEPVHVKRIYVLAGHTADTVICEPLKSYDKLKALHDNTYRLPFVGAMGLSAVHFQQLSALANQVAVTRLRRPLHGFHLDQLLDTLIIPGTRAGRLPETHAVVPGRRVAQARP